MRANEDMAEFVGGNSSDTASACGVTAEVREGEEGRKRFFLCVCTVPPLCFRPVTRRGE